MNTPNKPKDVNFVEHLTPGTMYMVYWKQQGGNYRWSMKAATWKFIDFNKNGDPIWSGRPVCGTQDMDAANFIKATPVPQNTKPTVPRRIGEWTNA
jgi:hypothetical protein